MRVVKKVVGNRTYSLIKDVPHDLREKLTAAGAPWNDKLISYAVEGATIPAAVQAVIDAHNFMPSPPMLANDEPKSQPPVKDETSDRAKQQALIDKATQGLSIGSPMCTVRPATVYTVDSLGGAMVRPTNNPVLHKDLHVRYQRPIVWLDVVYAVIKLEDDSERIVHIRDLEVVPEEESKPLVPGVIGGAFVNALSVFTERIQDLVCSRLSDGTVKVRVTIESRLEKFIARDEPIDFTLQFTAKGETGNQAWALTPADVMEPDRMLERAQFVAAKYCDYIEEKYPAAAPEEKSAPDSADLPPLPKQYRRVLQLLTHAQKIAFEQIWHGLPTNAGTSTLRVLKEHGLIEARGTSHVIAPLGRDAVIDEQLYAQKREDFAPGDRVEYVWWNTMHPGGRWSRSTELGTVEHLTPKLISVKWDNPNAFHSRLRSPSDLRKLSLPQREQHETPAIPEWKPKAGDRVWWKSFDGVAYGILQKRVEKKGRGIIWLIKPLVSGLPFEMGQSALNPAHNEAPLPDPHSVIDTSFEPLEIILLGGKNADGTERQITPAICKTCGAQYDHIVDVPSGFGAPLQELWVYDRYECPVCNMMSTKWVIAAMKAGQEPVPTDKHGHPITVGCVVAYPMKDAPNHVEIITAILDKTHFMVRLPGTTIEKKRIGGYERDGEVLEDAPALPPQAWQNPAPPYKPGDILRFESAYGDGELVEYRCEDQRLLDSTHLWSQRIVGEAEWIPVAGFYDSSTHNNKLWGICRVLEKGLHPHTGLQADTRTRDLVFDAPVDTPYLDQLPIAPEPELPNVADLDEIFDDMGENVVSNDLMKRLRELTEKAAVAAKPLPSYTVRETNIDGIQAWNVIDSDTGEIIFSDIATEPLAHDLMKLLGSVLPATTQHAMALAELFNIGQVQVSPNGAVNVVSEVNIPVCSASEPDAVIAYAKQISDEAAAHEALLQEAQQSTSPTGEYWWIDTDERIFRDDNPVAEHFAVLCGPYSSHMEAIEARLTLNMVLKDVTGRIVEAGMTVQLLPSSTLFLIDQVGERSPHGTWAIHGRLLPLTSRTVPATAKVLPRNLRIIDEPTPIEPQPQTDPASTTAVSRVEHIAQQLVNTIAASRPVENSEDLPDYEWGSDRVEWLGLPDQPVAGDGCDWRELSNDDLDLMPLQWQGLVRVIKNTLRTGLRGRVLRVIGHRGLSPRMIFETRHMSGGTSLSQTRLLNDGDLLSLGGSAIEPLNTGDIVIVPDHVIAEIYREHDLYFCNPKPPFIVGDVLRYTVNRGMPPCETEWEYRRDEGTVKKCGRWSFRERGTDTWHEVTLHNIRRTLDAGEVPYTGSEGIVEPAATNELPPATQPEQVERAIDVICVHPDDTSKTVSVSVNAAIIGQLAVHRTVKAGDLRKMPTVTRFTVTHLASRLSLVTSAPSMEAALDLARRLQVIDFDAWYQAGHKQDSSFKTTKSIVEAWGVHWQVGTERFRIAIQGAGQKAS